MVVVDLPRDAVLGVLGGLGPEASTNFMATVIERTPADRDQDHVEMVVYNDPKIPDRNEAIRGNGESPLPRLQRNANRLEQAGVDLIVIASNTTHYYHNDVEAVVDIPVPNMIEITAEHISNLNVSEVGVLTTTTARETKLYESALGSETDVTYPDQMDTLMNAIYAHKSGEIDKSQVLFDSVVGDFLTDGPDAAVLGCTEFSTLQWSYSVPAIDPVKCLSDYCIEHIQSG